MPCTVPPDVPCTVLVVEISRRCGRRHGPRVGCGYSRRVPKCRSVRVAPAVAAAFCAVVLARRSSWTRLQRSPHAGTRIMAVRRSRYRGRSDPIGRTQLRSRGIAVRCVNTGGIDPRRRHEPADVGRAVVPRRGVGRGAVVDRPTPNDGGAATKLESVGVGDHRRWRDRSCTVDGGSRGHAGGHSIAAVEHGTGRHRGPRRNPVPRTPRTEHDPGRRARHRRRCHPRLGAGGDDQPERAVDRRGMRVLGDWTTASRHGSTRSVPNISRFSRVSSQAASTSPWAWRSPGWATSAAGRSRVLWSSACWAMARRSRCGSAVPNNSARLAVR